MGASSLLAAVVASVLGISGTEVTRIGVGSALTLPAQRHLVRLDPPGGNPVWLLAIQKDGQDGLGLVFFRSDDEARTWHYEAPIQNDDSHRDRADLVRVGDDLALVYSYEGSSISGSTAHDVYFQWWRFQSSTRSWTPQPAVRVLDSTSSTTAFHRGELAVDSMGRIWVTASKLESDGTFSVVIAVSEDDGASFTRQADLDRLSRRAGGRLLSLGTRLILLYDAHDSGTAARLRVRDDSAPVGSWGPITQAIPEGVYHGAALSAVADGAGGMHLVYKSESQDLYYRAFDGTRFGPATLLLADGDWAVQPAISLRGSDLFVFYNRPVQLDLDYEAWVTVRRGETFGSPVLLDDVPEFKGYPAAADRLPAEVSAVPCFFSTAPDAASGPGWAKLVFEVLASPEQPDGGTPPPDAGGFDAGTADVGITDAAVADAGSPDAGIVDAGTVDAGIVDAGIVDAGLADGGSFDSGSGATDGGTAPDAGSQPALLFADNFNRSSSNLGSSWQVWQGRWRLRRSRAESDRNSSDLARARSIICADCEVAADVTSFGRPAAVILRAPSGSAADGYRAVLDPSSGRVRIERWRGGQATLLGSAASGVSRYDTPTRLGLSASGSNPVSLVAFVNGVPVLSATDGGAQALIAAGESGMWTNWAGVRFDNFELWSLGGGGSGGGGDAGTGDAGFGDAGAGDAGTIDAGTIDAGTGDAGSADGGSPDVGGPDAGTDAGGADAGAPDAGGAAGALYGLIVSYSSTAFDFMAVDPRGTGYAVAVGSSGNSLYASSDGRSWTYRGSAPGGGSFRVMTALSDGTLLGDSIRSGSDYVVRSVDSGAHWTEVATLGSFRWLTPHNVAELGGAVYMLDYQGFTTSNTPIRLWRSTDRGASWSVRYTFLGHRHGHGLVADPVRGALWAYFGDNTAQSGTYRSLDGGLSWTAMLLGQPGDVVDATVLADGALLFGQDISYLPNLPHVGRIDWDGTYHELQRLSGPSYSIHALSGGGFVVGAAREPDADIYPPGEVSAHLYLSADGASWSDVLQYPRTSTSENARVDVYWELPSGELVLRMQHVQGFSERGYQLLVPQRR